MVESEINPIVQKFVEYFDADCERLLDFDKSLDNGKTPRQYLDELIETKNGWNKIAAVCRRMIICDRELDLEKGNLLMENTSNDFNKLNHEDQPYEVVRYFNTCGLISFRSGDYSSANESFDQAKKMAEKVSLLNFFIPDLTSNIIRTRFEFFRHTLPQKEFSHKNLEDIKYYKKRFKDFIEQFNNTITEWHTYKTDNKILNLIYGHGMASLFHNLGDCYHILSKILKTVDEAEANDAINKSESCHRQSLQYGEKVNDEYRQLQSKRYLSVISTVSEKEREAYRKQVLNGKWIRGKQIVYQDMIKNSTNSEDINDIIRTKLRLDKNERDKIGLLYNYNAIKTAINKGVKDIVNKNGDEFTLLNIAKVKIDVAEKMRNEFYLRYRRQAINEIRDDVLVIINDYWKQENYKKVINWSEKYSCRDLIELSQISLDKEKSLELTVQKEEKIEKLKKPIFEEDIKELNKPSKPLIYIAPSISSTIGDVRVLNTKLKKTSKISLSSTLGTKNYDDFLDLILAYESVLEIPSKDYHPESRDLYKELEDLIVRIPNEENTAVLKFLAFEPGGINNTGRAILIKKSENKIIEKSMEFNLDFVEPAKKIIEKINSYIECGGYPIVEYKKLIYIMCELFNMLNLKNEIIDIKNLFIIPDGELFQLPSI